MSEHFSEQKKIWEQQSEKVKERFPEEKIHLQIYPEFLLNLYMYLKTNRILMTMQKS